MTSDTPNPTSPTPEPTETPNEQTPEPMDIAAASAKFLAETEGQEGLPERDPATGRFVKKEEATPEVTPEATREVTPEGTPDATAETTPESTEEVASEESAEEPAPEFKVVLKGHADRGEADMELVLPDAESVERFNRAVNDGLRRKDYEAKMQAVQKQEAEVKEFFTALEHNPIGTVLNAIPRDASLEVARALVAEHWDALFPEVQQFANDPTRVRETRLDARERSMQADRQTQAAIQAERNAREVMQAVETLIPDGVSEEVRSSFARDAERDLIELAQRGVAIAPSAVSQLLDRRIQMYGFAAKDPVKPAKPVVAKRIGTADSSKTPDVATVKQAQARIKQVVTAQTAAAKTPPAGRGAAVVRKPLLDGTETIEEATAKLFQQGFDLPTS